MRYFFLLLILCGSAWVSCAESGDTIRFAEIRNVYKSVSPTMASICRLPLADRQTALFDLIRKGLYEGFPLIEADPLYEDYVFMTFVYVDSIHRYDIGFEVYGIYEEHRFGDRKLHRLDSTNVYYRSYMVPDDICFSYRFILTDTLTGQTQKVTDPYNRNLTPTGERGRYRWSVLDLRPDEPDWYTKRYEETGSRIDTLCMNSRILDNARNVYVYLPPGYDGTDRDYPVIYLFDSFIYLNRIEVPNVLDNLIHEQKLEPMVAIFIDNPTSTSRDYELPMNPLFRDFMVQELLPEIKNKYRITGDPDRTIVGGMSYGGLAAAYLAFECDSIFGKVLSQSGGFWRDPDGKFLYADNDRTDFLINRFIREEKRNISLFLDWGLQEDMVLGANRKFVRVLDRLGYEFQWREFNGWHDWSNSRKTFPEGLLYLMNRGKNQKNENN